MPTDEFQQAVERGRAKLMLRLPALRSELSQTRKPWLDELCEAYEVATAALEKFRHSNHENDRALIPEYETFCAEIEADVQNDLQR